MELDNILLKPNLEQLNSNAQRIRRNLVLTSTISLFVTIGTAQIDMNQSSFIGIKFQNLTIDTVYWFLGVATFYFLVHFVWTTFDHLKENTLKLTGIVIPLARTETTAGGHPYDPNTSDPRQSTMYSWWCGRRYLFDEMEEIVESLKWQVDTEKYEQAVGVIESHLKHTQEEHEFIRNVLEKFDHGFWKYQRSQLFRWIIMDFLIPCILGCATLVAIVIKLAI